MPTPSVFAEDDYTILIGPHDMSEVHQGRRVSGHSDHKEQQSSWTVVLSERQILELLVEKHLNTLL